MCRVFLCMRVCMCGRRHYQKTSLTSGKVVVGFLGLLYCPIRNRTALNPGKFVGKITITEGGETEFGDFEH